MFILDPHAPGHHVLCSRGNAREARGDCPMCRRLFLSAHEEAVRETTSYSRRLK